MPINVKELNSLANYFAKRKKPVHMGTWANDCGTDGCIAGWCVLLNGWKIKPITECSRFTFDAECTKGKSKGHVRTVAAKILGLSKPREEQLFYSDNWDDIGIYCNSYKVPSKTVAKAIRKYIKQWTREDEHGVEC